MRHIREKKRNRLKEFGKGFLPFFAVGALWLGAEAGKTYQTEVIAEPNKPNKTYTVEDKVVSEPNEPFYKPKNKLDEDTKRLIELVKVNMHYTVQDGDTLEDIAKEKEIPYIRLKLGNQDIDIDRLRIGQVINTPRRQDLDLQSEKGVDYDSLYSSLIEYEDLRTKVYPDSKGIPTTGVGFNLKKAWAKERIEELGYDYESVLQGKQEISKKHALELMREDAALAVLDAKNYIGRGWKKLHPEAKEIVIDMAYNMGEEFGGIWSLRACLNREFPDYADAAKRMKTYKWYKDTGRRGKELTEKKEKLSRIYNPSINNKKNKKD
jgi:GH24 family phage-related lysozyme (muramidase)